MSNDEAQSPMTDDEIDLSDEDTVYNICMFRATSTDEEWDDDYASGQWDLSREEAARRLDEEDYSDPFA